MVLSMPILLDTLWHLTCKWTFPLLQSIFVQCSRSPISRVLSPMSVMVGNASQGSVLASFSVFFARDDGVSDVAAPVNTIPFPLLVTFSQPLSADLSSSHFTLVNCAVSSISMLNPTLARVMLVPFLRSDFSVILSTGVLTSSAGASNTAAAASSHTAVPAADTAACRQSRRSVVPRIVFLSPLNLPDPLDQGDDHTDHHCRRDGHKERQHRQGRRTGRIHLESPEEEPDQPRHQD